MSGRTHHSLNEERVKDIYNENCKTDQNGNIGFTELTRLAHLIDNPLIKIGWDPISLETTHNMQFFPEKLSKFLAENRNLSSLLTADMAVQDELGNDLKIERWVKKANMTDLEQ